MTDEDINIAIYIIVFVIIVGQCAIKVYLSNLTKRKSYITLVIPEILTGFNIKKLTIRKIGMNEQQLMSTELLILIKENNSHLHGSLNNDDINVDSTVYMYRVLDTDCPSHFVSLKLCENSTHRTNLNKTADAHLTNFKNSVTTNGLMKRVANNNIDNSNNSCSIETSSRSNRGHVTQNDMIPTKVKNIDRNCFEEYDDNPNKMDPSGDALEMVSLRGERYTKPSDFITPRPPLSSVRNSLLITKKDFSKLDVDSMKYASKLSNNIDSMKSLQKKKSNTTVQSPSSSYSSSSVELKTPLNSSMPSLIQLQKSTRTSKSNVKKLDGETRSSVAPTNNYIAANVNNNHISNHINNINGLNGNNNNGTNNCNNSNSVNSFKEIKKSKTSSASSENSTLSSINCSSEHLSLTDHSNSTTQKHKNEGNNKLTTSRRQLPQVAFPEEMVEEKRYLLSKKLEQRIIRRVSSREVSAFGDGQINSTKSQIFQSSHFSAVKQNESDFDCKSVTSEEVANILAEAGPMGVVESDYEEPRTPDCREDGEEEVSASEDDNADLFVSKKNRFPSLFDLMKNRNVEDSDFEDLVETNKLKGKLVPVKCQSNNNSLIKTTGFVPYSKSLQEGSLTSPVRTTETPSTTTTTLSLPTTTSLKADASLPVTTTSTKHFLSLYDLLDSKFYQLFTTCQHVHKTNNNNDERIILPFEIINSTITLSIKSVSTNEDDYVNNNVNNQNNYKDVIFSVCVVGRILNSNDNYNNNNNNDTDNKNTFTNKTSMKLRSMNKNLQKHYVPRSATKDDENNFQLQQYDVIVEINGKNALLMDASQLTEELSSSSSSSSASSSSLAHPVTNNISFLLVVARRIQQ
ncbi:hypothetical protein HELRODRAFT_190503 [Helobdella robusta]|uniref:Uncharacterized protein n=1 Tax=Helobdella robusta TaxID=6412 RepID=T1FS18_HELRO|nr:hypothetical protein HELRODRAFT_190503 [Helobdella robusta]ESO09460.1 hypothetical protein HELRODRAFT_190503 [Helobdella robusta]